MFFSGTKEFSSPAPQRCDGKQPKTLQDLPGCNVCGLVPRQPARGVLDRSDIKDRIGGLKFFFLQDDLDARSGPGGVLGQTEKARHVSP